MATPGALVIRGTRQGARLNEHGHGGRKREGNSQATEQGKSGVVGALVRRGTRGGVQVSEHGPRGFCGELQI
jgi:hypothetical protein